MTIKKKLSKKCESKIGRKLDANQWLPNTSMSQKYVSIKKKWRHKHESQSDKISCESFAICLNSLPAPKTKMDKTAHVIKQKEIKK